MHADAPQRRGQPPHAGGALPPGPRSPSPTLAHTSAQVAPPLPRTSWLGVVRGVTGSAAGSAAMCLASSGGIVDAWTTPGICWDAMAGAIQ